MPSAIRNFTTPLVTVVVMVPLVLLTVGPVTIILSQWISDAITFVMSSVPWLGGALLGGLWQVLVVFGMHWALIPVMINEFATEGFSVIAPPLMAAVLAQAAATLAIVFRSR